MKSKIFIILSVSIYLAVFNGPSIASPGDFSGPYPLNGLTPGVANWWATSVVGSSGHNNPQNILGPVNGDWAVGSPSGGSITVGFDVTITNKSGYDFVIWENGFWSTFSSDGSINPHDGVFAELGFVDVSTDGLNWVTFPSTYLETMTPYPNIDPTYVHNLAGNYVSIGTPYEGTPFDLDDILGTMAVLDGLVDPNKINYVRLRDILGAGEGGNELDSLGNTIYDGNGFGGGADWDAVGVINAVPIPGSVLLFGSGLLGALGLRRKKTV